MGTWQRYLALLVVGSLGGNIFSAVLAPYDYGVGASTSLFSVLAALCVWFYLNYSGMGMQQMQYMIFFGLMVFFALLNGFMSPGSAVDSWGHMGGFLVGLAVSFLLIRPIDMSQERALRRFKVPSIMAMFLILIGMTVLLFVRPLPYCEQINCARICD